MKSKSIKKKDFSYFDNSDILIHSSFYVNNDKCIHSINKLGIENKEIIKKEYNYNDYFINNNLITYINEFCESRKIKDIEIIPCTNNSLYIIRIFDKYNNIVSVENITKRFARDLRRRVKNIVFEENLYVYKSQNRLSCLTGYVNKFGLIILLLSLILIIGLLLAISFIL